MSAQGKYAPSMKHPSARLTKKPTGAAGRSLPKGYDIREAMGITDKREYNAFSLEDILKANVMARVQARAAEMAEQKRQANALQGEQARKAQAKALEAAREADHVGKERKPARVKPLLMSPTGTQRSRTTLPRAAKNAKADMATGSKVEQSSRARGSGQQNNNNKTPRREGGRHEWATLESTGNAGSRDNVPPRMRFAVDSSARRQ
ncbi:hypothetical protein HD554DRAFT_2167343 [Boletus coccyginus]|nr:hypothetical protein HD554DRAFT_2167343 [Boletus coccyginus]